MNYNACIRTYIITHAKMLINRYNWLHKDYIFQISSRNINVTVFWNIDHLCTRTEIPSFARTLMHYPALDNRLLGLLLQTAFTDAAKS